MCRNSDIFYFLLIFFLKRDFIFIQNKPPHCYRYWFLTPVGGQNLRDDLEDAQEHANLTGLTVFNSQSNPSTNHAQPGHIPFFDVQKDSPVRSVDFSSGTVAIKTSRGLTIAVYTKSVFDNPFLYTYDIRILCTS